MKALIPCYKRKDDSGKGVMITMPREEVECKLREWGTPEFWKCYRQQLPKGMPIDLLTPDQDDEATAATMLKHVIVEIWYEGQSLTQEQIRYVVHDSAYWELVRDIRLASADRSNFVDKRVEEIAGNSPATSKRGKLGVESIPVPKKAGQI